MVDARGLTDDDHTDAMGSVGVPGVAHQVMGVMDDPAPRPPPQPKKLNVGTGCFPLVLAVVAFVAAAVAVFIGGKLGENGIEGAGEPAATTASTATSGAEAGTETGGAIAPPSPADLPAGAELLQGSSGGPIGCITCDGQSRFLHLRNNTTAAGGDQQSDQEILWPEDGTIVDFGVTISRPNRGRYGINLFVNSGYSNGCALETGQSACRMNQAGERLLTDDRVTIIVGEGGTVDERGVPVDDGDFVLEWWLVFQPDA